jgi:hypothetical protein
MIGLETIQVIQTIYFSRIIITSAPTSLLQSINTIEYAATGYKNIDVIFGNSFSELLQTENYASMKSEFNLVDFEKYFLQNINLALLPLLITPIVLGLKLLQKTMSRNKFI